ncbi:putative phage portal protein [Nocardia nova SH22a]|uniref:Putative phage portal protein n=1 Tax=Nocardia nova SH22a TaxID=1415166 RepID=W5TNN8_9NOCA|nr:phage portal protein [Nocardia nova]AHH20847.1 putative phage portal protein [Nocardia nova SH22a]
MLNSPDRTPAEWLPILTRRLDLDMSRMRLLERYLEGDAPLPEAARSQRASWQKFQAEARTNWAELIVESSGDRIVPNGIEVAGSTDSPEAKRAQRIWLNNRMDLVFGSAVRDMLAYGEGILTGWFDPDGRKAVITAASPLTTVAATDPQQPWRVRAAFKWWRDLDLAQDGAIVWIHGGYQLFSRPCYTDQQTKRRRLYTTASGGWRENGDAVITGKEPPVVLLQNPRGFGEYETHLDLINRINRGILHRLHISAMQAYKQRALKTAEGSEGLPDKDDKGNDIDYAKLFEPAPGALWDLPPGIDIWESAATDIRPLLEGSMQDIRQLAGVTRTPVSVLIPDSANQAAAGAALTKEGLITKCGKLVTVSATAAAAILVKALDIEGVALGDEQPLTVLFKPPDQVSLTEKYAAALQARNAGESWASIARNILGYSPEQIAQDALDRAQEQLAQALYAPAPPPNPQPIAAGNGVPAV